jgi:hypothetical protein
MKPFNLTITTVAARLAHMGAKCCFTLILGAVGIGLCQSVPYDAVGDFSTTSNPTGPWSYGWKPTPGGAFTLSAVENSSIYQGIDLWEGTDYCGVEALRPFVGLNHTGATLNYASGVSQPANMLVLHPSCTGKFSVLRWTAPTTGSFNIVGLFQGIDTRNTTTDVHVMQNSATALLNASIDGFGNQVAFNFSRLLSAGDTLDFVVGVGSNGTFWNDSTGLAVTITPVGPNYHVCLLYDPTKAVHSGATYPIKLQLCDASGNNLSSSTIVLHATSITLLSNSISGPVQSSGDANPNSEFRFDPSLGATGGYIFNFSTKGLATGTYNLNFTVTGEQSVYVAPFQVK